MTLAAVVLAGAVGAVLRDEVIAMVRRRAGRPALRGVAVVNVSGALLLGLLAGAGPMVLAIVGTGLLGGYTTFSTWMVESALVSRRRAMVNVVGQTVVGVLAAAVGVATSGLLRAP